MYNMYENQNIYIFMYILLLYIKILLYYEEAIMN